MDTQAEPRGTLGERRYDLDWVRICAFMLLIFYHVGMYYVTWDWHVKSPHASTTLEPLMMLTSPWRLLLLFLVSGVATAYLLDRKGSRGFLAQRSTRLLVPLLFGMAVIVPPQSYLEVIEKLSYSGGYLDFLKLYFTAYHGICRGSDCLILPTWNHLWFVAYLWIYTVLLYLLVRVLPRFTASLRQLAEAALGGTGMLLWPIAFLALARITMIGFYPPNHAVAGDWYNHATYGMVFLLGYVLAGTKSPWMAAKRARWVSLGLAILGWAFLASYYGYYSESGSLVPPQSLKLFQRFIYGVEQWLAIIAALGFARRHLMKDNAARRYLTTAIFPIYILHQTVIVTVAHSIQPANLDPRVEGTLLILVTGAACFLGYEVIRRVKILRPFFGLTVESSDQAAPGPTVTRGGRKQWGRSLVRSSSIRSSSTRSSAPTPWTARIALPIPQDVQ